MLSSRTEQGQELAQLYDRAFEAVVSEDLLRAREHVTAAGQLIDRLGPALHEFPSEIAQRIQEAYGRLVHVTAFSLEGTKEELRQVQSGRKTLAKFARNEEQSGARLNREL